MSTSVDINGNKIRLLREQKELTQLYLATVVGVTTDTISRWENRRYPTIKLENARKLAEALGVEVEELLDGPDPMDGAGAEVHPEAAAAGTPSPGFAALLRTHRRGLILAGGLLLVAAISLVFFLSSRRSGLNSERILPKHTAANLPFPVLVRVGGAPEAVNTLLIREELIGEAEATGASPEGEAHKQFGRNPRWIGHLVNGQVTFLYLVQPGKKLRPPEEIRFKGELIVGEGLSLAETIGGADRIALTPYHWVDLDQDYEISDSEILKAHETYDLPGANLIDFSAIEELWLAGQYTLNKKTQTFVPVRQAEARE